MRLFQPHLFILLYHECVIKPAPLGIGYMLIEISYKVTFLVIRN